MGAACAPSGIAQLYTASRILGSKVWARRRRAASKGGYAPPLFSMLDTNFREVISLLNNSFVPDSGFRFAIKNAHSGAFPAQSKTVSRPNTAFVNSLWGSRKSAAR